MFLLIKRLFLICIGKPMVIPNTKKIDLDYPEPNRESNIDVGYKFLPGYRIENGARVIKNIDKNLVNAHEHTGIVQNSIWDWPVWDYRVKFQDNMVSYFDDHEISRF